MNDVIVEDNYLHLKIDGCTMVPWINICIGLVFILVTRVRVWSASSPCLLYSVKRTDALPVFIDRVFRVSVSVVTAFQNVSSCCPKRPAETSRCQRVCSGCWSQDRCPLRSRWGGIHWFSYSLQVTC